MCTTIIGVFLMILINDATETNKLYENISPPCSVVPNSIKKKLNKYNNIMTPYGLTA